ncbi:alpha/beta fold hydrolase, partial [Streptomyces sp. 2MCAF27]
MTGLVRSETSAAKVTAAGATPVIGDTTDSSWLAGQMAQADGTIHTASPGDETSSAVQAAVADAAIAACTDSGKPFVLTSRVTACEAPAAGSPEPAELRSRHRTPLPTAVAPTPREGITVKVENKTIDGVFIEHVPSEGSPSGPPIVFVHGGLQGSWAWENYLPYFAAAGHDSYAFSWFNHHGSQDLPEDQFTLRSMADTVEELETVVDHIGHVPILITHSMGALVGLKYAEKHPVLAQVHITPAISAEVGLHPNTAIDLTQPTDIPDFETAW